jgi:hypothetical protein
MENGDFSQQKVEFALEDQQIQAPPMPTVGDLEVYRLVFELFDRDNSGFIENQDLAAIAVKIGLTPEEGKFIYNC